MNLKSIRNNRRFQRKVGEYPCCDYLNNALMFLLQQKEISNGSRMETTWQNAKEVMDWWLAESKEEEK